MNLEKLIEEADSLIKKYESQEKLGVDEELQLLSCAYAKLFLTACAQGSKDDLGHSHEKIAACFRKLGDSGWAEKHDQTAKAYLSMS